MLNIFKNLVSRSLLSKNEFKMVFKYNKFIFNKNRLYMGKGCPINGILKMNVMTILQDFSNNNEANSFGYLLESSNLWHDRLEYVNFNSLGS